MNENRKVMNNNDKKNPLKRPPLRQAGQSDAEVIQNLNSQIWLFIGIGLVFVLFAYSEWISYLYKAPPQPIIWSCLALIAILVCGYFIRRLYHKRENWKLGRQGEIEVGNYLEELRTKGFNIFHDIQCDEEGLRFNVDHLIVSCHGIFAIETKTPRKLRHGANRVEFDGQNIIKISGHAADKKTISSALSKSRWLRDNVLPKRSDQKKYNVFPVIVYPEWSVIGAQFGRDVWVINPKMLQWEIPKQPVSLTQEECNSVSQVLIERNR
jgi:hypothetical protein